MEIKGFKDTIAWYDNNAAEYAKNLSAVVPLEGIEKFLGYLPANPYILEAGCGPGRESKIFLERGSKIVGVDLSAGMLKIAKEKNPQAKYLLGNFLELPLQSDTFDGVYAQASLVHLETVEEAGKALAEFFRVLKPGGVLYVQVKAQTGEEKTAVVADTLVKHRRFFRYYTQKELIRSLKEAGFEIIEASFKADPHGRNEVRWIECVARKPKHQNAP